MAPSGVSLRSCTPNSSMAYCLDLCIQSSISTQPISAEQALCALELDRNSSRSTPQDTCFSITDSAGSGRWQWLPFNNLRKFNGRRSRRVSSGSTTQVPLAFMFVSGFLHLLYIHFVASGLIKNLHVLPVQFLKKILDQPETVRTL